MRVLVIAHIPNSREMAESFRSNPAGVGAQIASFMQNAKVEAAYFGSDWGKRTGYFILDLPSADMIPQISEPLFVNLGAEVEIKPVMKIEDLKKGLEHLKL